MPELPDVTVYAESLAAKVAGSVLQRIRIANPFLLRTALPPIGAAEGRAVQGVGRLGKRVVIELQGDTPDEPWFLVLHLMIAGRLRWYAAGAKAPAKGLMAALEFPAGTLAFTEAGTQRRASMHLVAGRAALAAMDPGGLEPVGSKLADFRERLLAGNHTLKRALTDPQSFSGIGNAYSDEILHRARLSPVALTRSLDDEAIARLHAATQQVLAQWTDKLRGGARWRLAAGGHGLSPRLRGARPLRPALPGVRRARAAHRLREQRDELLRPLPDGRSAARRPGLVAPAEGQLAEDAGRVRRRVAPGTPSADVRVDT